VAQSRSARLERWDQLIGENLIYGKGSARDWGVSLIVDRLIGIATGPHATAGRIMVTDFAAKYLEGGASVATR